MDFTKALSEKTTHFLKSKTIDQWENYFADPKEAINAGELIRIWEAKRPLFHFIRIITAAIFIALLPALVIAPHIFIKNALLSADKDAANSIGTPYPSYDQPLFDMVYYIYESVGVSKDYIYDHLYLYAAICFFALAISLLVAHLQQRPINDLKEKGLYHFNPTSLKNARDNLQGVKEGCLESIKSLPRQLRAAMASLLRKILC